MSAFDKVLDVVSEWKPGALGSELKYRDSLARLLRKNLSGVTVEKEYRHNGTTTDIHVKHSGFFGSSEVYVELKRNLRDKSQLDRLVGQIESLEPKEHEILVVLCGSTRPELFDRLKRRYKWSRTFFDGVGVAIVTKPARQVSESDD